MLSAIYSRSLACLGCLLAFAFPAPASDVEKREFSILIDGKESGTSRMVVTVQDDGTTVMQGNCVVKFAKLLFSHSFEIESTEWWKDGKLIALKSKATENGKKFDVSAAADAKGIRLKINGDDRLAAADAWTTSYWKLADARFHNKAVPLLDPQDGKEYKGELKYVATESILIGKAPQQCYRFRISGGPQTTDLWYDRYHRLVREEFAELGHKIIVQLNSIQR
ncbi:MAG: DUF6134 family protein [Gemmataceae bacterium]